MTETIMGWLPWFLQPIADFLNITFIDKPWIFISMWSLVHLIVGALIYFIVRKNKIGSPMIATFLILGLWELFEIFMFYVTFMFIPESLADTCFDMVFGVGGAVLVWLYLDHN